METNIDFDFHLDEEALELRSETDQLPFDKDVTLAFIKGNNIGFVITKEEKISEKDTGKIVGIHLAYRLTAQAAEKCHFESITCHIGLGGIGAVVRDMDPASVKEGDPVKYMYKEAGDIKLTLVPLPVKTTVKGETTAEVNLYKTEIVAYGIDKTYARWEFRKPVNRELREDRILQLLAELSGQANNDLSVEVTLRFKLKADNISGMIPFWGKKTIPLKFSHIF